MSINKIQFSRVVIFLFIPIITILQSCTTLPLRTNYVESLIQGRFSLVFLEKKQSTQGRFIWKIYNNKNSKIEEFFFMDPWGKTRGILMRDISEDSDSWTLLNSNYQPIKKKYVKNWLKKHFKLTYIELKSLTLPINLSSQKFKKYLISKNKSHIINVISDTKLGKIQMKFLPEN